jgi:hypothetical protein
MILYRLMSGLKMIGPSLPLSYSASLRSLGNECLQKDDDTRPTMSYIYQQLNGHHSMATCLGVTDSEVGSSYNIIDIIKEYTNDEKKLHHNVIPLYVPILPPSQYDDPVQEAVALALKRMHQPYKRLTRDHFQFEVDMYPDNYIIHCSVSTKPDGVSIYLHYPGRVPSGTHIIALCVVDYF